MRKLIIILAVLLYANFVFAADSIYIYIMWSGQKQSTTRVVLLGLPDSPVTCTFNSAQNPDNPDDTTYYKVDYDFNTVPAGDYTLTAKMVDEKHTEIWDDGKTHVVGGESSESPPFPFVVESPAEILGMGLDVQ